MSDEWSLKDKERYKSSGYDYDNCFYAKDIETLRKKLIEDIWRHFHYNLNHNLKGEGIEIEKIINKRFGVKE